jgi:F-type H+-transporting ATPase subunit gamma
MASLKELKGRINSVKSTQKITKAKKMVAAAKLRKAQAAAEAARPYAERLEGVVASLATKVGGADSAPRLLSGTGKDDHHLLVVLNSDRGLAGAFNSNIVKAARDKAYELQAAGKKVSFFLVGRKVVRLSTVCSLARSLNIMKPLAFATSASTKPVL